MIFTICWSNCWGDTTKNAIDNVATSQCSGVIFGIHFFFLGAKVDIMCEMQRPAQTCNISRWKSFSFFPFEWFIACGGFSRSLNTVWSYLIIIRAINWFYFLMQQELCFSPNWNSLWSHVALHVSVTRAKDNNPIVMFCLNSNSSFFLNLKIIQAVVQSMRGFCKALEYTARRPAAFYGTRTRCFTFYQRNKLQR